MFDLATIWAAIIAFAVLTYVILDGFDLGIGILFPFAKTDQDRDTMMNSVAPVWDGNETWLVMGGGGLFAVFPLAYAVVMPALYMPITLMLLALVFRGVAFEYRWRTKRWKPVWDVAFAGGWWDWLTGFSILTGIAVVFGYALLGSTWLVMKTPSNLQKQMQSFSWPLALITLALIGVVSLLTPLQNPVYFERWFTWPQLGYSAVVPILLTYASYRLFWGLKTHKDISPFLSTLAIFILCFTGIGISFDPNIIPPSLSIAEAAAPDKSLAFALVGTVILVPIILAYTAYAYWVFRGKIDPSEGYH